MRSGFIAGLISLVLLAAVPRARAQLGTVQGHVVVEHLNKHHQGNNANVVVWLSPLDAPAPRSQDVHHYQILQKNKEFSPHLLVIPLGSEVAFPNQDVYFHNVFSLYQGERFDLGLYEDGVSRAVRFEKPGVSFVFCNIHPNMSAYVVTLETPNFAMSDHVGTFTIANVPPGRYQLTVWYERATSKELDALSRELVVAPSGNSLGTLRIHESAELPQEHLDKYGRPYEPQHTSPY